MSETQLQRFNKLLRQTLEPLLQQTNERRNQIASDMQEYSKLKKAIEELQRRKETGKSRPMQVPIGSGVSVEAEIDPEYNGSVFVDTGVMGLSVEMPHADALTYLEKKLDLLQQRWDILTEKLEQTAEHIQLVRTGIKILVDEKNKE